MLDENKKQFLKNALQMGRVSLFLGAGFTKGATNISDRPIPDSWQLLKNLWSFNGYIGAPSDEEKLTTVYQATLKKQSREKIRTFLREQFVIKSYPDWMDLVPSFIWRKIYTTNIDDLVEKLYSNPKSPSLQTLRSLNAMTDDVEERDQAYSSLLKIALHGNLESAPDNVTFGTRQYASRSNSKYDPWYTDFIYEYSNHPMIFVGSKLDEPIFWQYVEARGEKFKDEKRPRSFLVVPTISPAHKDFLEEYNLHHIPAKGEEFFAWLASEFPKRPTRRDVLKASAPHLVPTVDAAEGGTSRRIVKSLEEFFLVFKPVAPEPKDPSYRKTAFHSGAIPTWQDIAHDLDAKRDITVDLFNAIAEKKRSNKPGLVVLHGTAGSGKSTIGRRLAWQLSANDFQVYFNESGRYPTIQASRNALEYIGGHPVLIVDDAHKSFGSTIKFIEMIQTSSVKPIVVVISRSSSAGNLIDESEKLTNITEMAIGLLSRDEIDSLISVLDKSGMLGRLQGLSNDQRVHEFEVRARKQILVALKEATQAKGFGEIIKAEYKEIEDNSARMLYLLSSLVTAHGHSIPKVFFMGAFGVSPSQCLSFLNRELRGLIIDVGERFIARHQIIAEHIVDSIADRSELKMCYLEILGKLSDSLGARPERRDRNFRLYKSLINHEFLIARFGDGDLECGREIYDTLKPKRKDDYHFWLQYSNYELAGRSLVHAQTYIDSASSLLDAENKKDHFVELTQVQIGMKRAIYQLNSIEAQNLFKTSRERIESLIKDQGRWDAYPYHVYAHNLRLWAMHKEQDQRKRMKLVKDAKSIVEKGLNGHVRNKQLLELFDTLRADEYKIAGNLAWEEAETAPALDESRPLFDDDIWDSEPDNQ